MRKIIIFFLTLLPCYFVTLLPCSAQELKLLPEKDTYVDSNDPDKSFGEQNTLQVGFTHSSKIAFLKFDLSNITQDSKPEKAFLNLELVQSIGQQKPIQTEILLPSKDWNEQELNWNNKPSLYKTDLTISLEATPGAQSIEITPIVNQWLDGTTKNYGLALFQRGENFERTYLSKENKTNPPNLTFGRNEKVPAVGGVQSLMTNKENKKDALEILALEENQKTTNTATPSTQTTNNQQPTTNRPSPIPNPQSLIPKIINSKNILILGLGLLALATVAGEKIVKKLRKKEN